MNGGHRSMGQTMTDLINRQLPNIFPIQIMVLRFERHLGLSQFDPVKRHPLYILNSCFFYLLNFFIFDVWIVKQIKIQNPSRLATLLVT